MGKYSLDFVNKGKDFDMPNWTVEKHENALAHLLEDFPESKSEDAKERLKIATEQNKQLIYYIIYESLKDIDSNVDIEKIKNLHPDDLTELYNAVYSAGRKGILAENFRQTKSKKKSK